MQKIYTLKFETRIHLIGFKSENEFESYEALTQEVLENLEDFKNTNIADTIKNFGNNERIFIFACKTKRYERFIESLKSFSDAKIKTDTGKRKKNEDIIITNNHPHAIGENTVGISLLHNLGREAKKILMP